MTASPLSATSPDALTALFLADPLTLSDADLMVLITEERRRRNVHASEEAAKALKPKSPRTKATSAPATPALSAPTGEISLSDLD